MKDLRELSAPCGLDCFNCELLDANVTDEMREALAPKLGIPPGEVRCMGCREQKGLRLGLPLCETWKCADERGVEFCHECAEFPCAKLMPAADGADRYPHNMKLFNLCRMRSVGLEQWAREAADIRKRYFKGRFVIGLGPVMD